MRTPSVNTVLSKLLIGVIGVFGAAGTAALTAPVAAADPPLPPAPNINAWPPANSKDYLVNENLYAFAGPNGITCVISRTATSYGCAGPLPGAPGNVVTGGPAGQPGFSTTNRPLYAADKPATPLPPQTRLSFATISCGVDVNGAVICSNSFDQTGFVLGPAESYSFGAVNPLLDRPEGTNPFMN